MRARMLRVFILNCLREKRFNTVNQKSDIRKRFRKVAWGRLYWKANDRRDSRKFDSDDVCIVQDGVVSTHYKTLEALIEDIEDAEAEFQRSKVWDYAEDYGDGECGGNRSHVEVR